MTEEQIIKEGYLIKQGRIVKSWKKRWFVLYSNCIVYYEKPREIEKGKFFITPETSVIYIKNNKKPSMKIETFNRTYICVGQTEYEIKKWIEAIQYAVHKLADPSYTMRPRNNNNTVVKVQKEIPICDIKYQPELILKYSIINSNPNYEIIQNEPEPIIFRKISHSMALEMQNIFNGS